MNSINQFASENDLYTEFFSQHDFSEMEKYPSISRLVSQFGIGERICEGNQYYGQYDHGSGQLTELFPSFAKDENYEKEYESGGYECLVRIADAYAAFVMELYKA